MRGQASIRIDRPQEAVFDFVTDPRNSAYWQAEVKAFETVRQTDGVGTQTRWVFQGGGYEVEAFETVVAVERPSIYASKHIMTRFLSGPPPDPGRTPDTEADLARQFQITYGKKPPEGLVALDFAPSGADGCVLTFRVETTLGGTAGLFTWIQKLMGRSQLRKRLEALKETIEAAPL